MWNNSIGHLLHLNAGYSAFPGEDYFDSNDCVLHAKQQMRVQFPNFFFLSVQQELFFFPQYPGRFLNRSIIAVSVSFYCTSVHLVPGVLRVCSF